MITKKLLVVLFSALIIPTMSDSSLMPWKTWLNFFPELEKIVACEAGENPKAIGDHGNSYGIFQIHLPSHKGITKVQAKDPYFSLMWAIDRYYAGELSIWTCARILAKEGKITLE